MYRKVIFFSNFHLPIVKSNIIAFLPTYRLTKSYMLEMSILISCSEKSIYTSLIAIFKNSENKNLLNTGYYGCKLFHTLLTSIVSLDR